jgi:glycerophosphoryl diester phosphodiesterase
VPGRPRVIAHRGASADVAEHTFAAYRRAIAEGADGLECDVRLTRDAVLVCVHDRTLGRTSSGRGSVSSFDFAELAALDFAAWREAPDRTGDGTDPEMGAGHAGVVTLEMLLDLVADAGRPIELAIETKHPTRYAGLVESTLVSQLTRRGLTGHDCAVRVMSFSAVGLRRVRQLDPTLQTVLLFKRMPLRLRDGWLPASVDVAGPSLEALRVAPELVDRVHDTGREVHVWTVDAEADLRFVTDLGVDAIITNRPATALEIVSPSDG